LPRDSARRTRGASIAALAVHPHVHADEIVVESDSGDAVLGGPGYGRRRAV